MRKIKKIFTNTRIIILIVFLLLAIIAINPSLNQEGVAIRSVMKDSAASLSGIENPEPNINPRAREIIKIVNNQRISNHEDYDNAIVNLKINDSVYIETNKGQYYLTVKPQFNITILPELEEINITRNELINGTNITINETVFQNKTISEIIGIEDIGLKVFDAPTTNIRKGLDLQGGTRVLLSPEKELSANDMDIVIEHMKQRLNVYGLSDIIIREAGDLPPPLGEGNQYIMVEVAGINEDEVKDLLSQQGKFEAKIGNEVVFSGGDDIVYVCRSSECSGIDPNYGCRFLDGQTEVCNFRFTITLSKKAAERQAQITKDLAVITVDESGNPISQNNQYLNETLDFYLDNELVDSLNIGKSLKGNAVTDIQISGSGTGIGRQNAIIETLQSMKNLQTVLITGSLPVDLEIVKVDTISPYLGQKFSKNVLLVGIFAILSVAIVIFLRYKTLNVVIPILISMSSEVLLLLGLASLIGWNLDLAAVAGIIIAVGTGVDHQIVITDETLDRNKRELLTWKQRIGKAFFIIMAAYFTTIVAMLPLWFAGAGLLKGFAITTIFGVTFGVFITRPAYAVLLEILERE